MLTFSLRLYYIIHLHIPITRGFLGGSVVRNPLAMQETRIWSLNQEDPLEKGMATHANILAWKIPWTEEPGGLQSLGSQRVGHHVAIDVNNTGTYLVDYWEN